MITGAEVQNLPERFPQLESRKEIEMEVDPEPEKEPKYKSDVGSDNTNSGPDAGDFVIAEATPTSPMPLWNAIILLVVAIIGIIGNIIVLIVFSRRGIRQRHRCNIFVRALAITDLIVCLMIPVRFLPIKPESEIMCKVYSLLNSFSLTFSIVLLQSIAIERFLAICKPLRRYSSRAQSATLIVSFVIMATVSCTFMIFSTVTEEESSPYGIATCDVTDPTMLRVTYGLFVTFYVETCVVLLFVYGKIYWVILQQHKWLKANKNVISVSGLISSGNDHNVLAVAPRNTLDATQRTAQTNLQTANNGARETNRRHYKTAVMFSCITVAFLLSWLPVTLDRISTAFRLSIFVPGTLTQLYLINSVVNPFLYSFFDNKIRGDIKLLLTCKIVCR